jgi:hypothetical protein
LRKHDETEQNNSSEVKHIALLKGEITITEFERRDASRFDHSTGIAKFFALKFF